MAVIADAGEAAFEVARPRAAHMQPGDARRHQIGRRGIFDDAVAARDPDFGNPYIADRFVDHEQAVAHIAAAPAALYAARAHALDGPAARGALHQARRAPGGHCTHLPELIWRSGAWVTRRTADA